MVTAKKVLDTRSLLCYAGSMKGAELRQILKQLEMSQNDFAEKAGVNQSSISRWLNEKTQMHPVMAKHLRRTAEELLEKAS